MSWRPCSSFHCGMSAGLFPEDWGGDTKAAGDFGERMKLAAATAPWFSRLRPVEGDPVDAVADLAKQFVFKGGGSAHALSLHGNLGGKGNPNAKSAFLK
jgi:hypothetical protein